MLEANQLPDATIVADLQYNAGITQMLKILGPEVGTMVNKTIAIRAMVLALIQVMGRPMVEFKPWMPISIRVSNFYSSNKSTMLGNKVIFILFQKKYKKIWSFNLQIFISLDI